MKVHLVSDDPGDKAFTIVLGYRDREGVYRALSSEIEVFAALSGIDENVRIDSFERD